MNTIIDHSSNSHENNFAWNCGDFSFCSSLGLLYTNEKYIHLSPKVSLVFNVLCQHSPNTINKLDILDIVWRNQEISDTAVADAIRTIRRALQPNKSVIATVPKQGYRITQELKKINIVAFEGLGKKTISTKRTNFFKKLKFFILALIIIGTGVYVWKISQSGPIQTNDIAIDVYDRAVNFYTRFNEEGNNKAIEILEEGIIKHPQNSKLYSALADTNSQIVDRYNTGKINKHYKNKALEFAKKAVKLDSDSAIAWKSLGFAYAVKGDYQSAKSSYQQAIKINPDFFYARSNLAHLERIQGNVALALEQFMYSLKLDKSDPYIYFHIGNCYRDVGLHGIANQWYLKGMDLKPDKIIDKHDYYMNLMFERKFRQVKSMIQKEHHNTNKDQEYLDFIELLISVYSQQTEQAQKLFTQYSIKQLANHLSNNAYAIEMQLTIFQLLNKESATYKFLLNNLQHAQVIWEEKVGFNPQPPDSYYSLAHIYANLEQYRKSNSMLETAIDKGFRGIQLLDLQPAFIKLHGNTQFEDIYKSLQNTINTEKQLVLDKIDSNI